MPTPQNTGMSLDQLLTSATDPATTAISAAPYEAVSTKLQQKMAAVSAALKEKTARLDSFNAAVASQADIYQAQQEAAANTWVAKTGFDPDGILGTATNMIASAVTGASRDLIGKTAAMPFSFDAFAKDNALSSDDVNSYNNFVKGAATPADMARLQAKRDVASPIGGEEGSLAPSQQMSLLDMIKQADSSRNMARKINTMFDISSIENQDHKNALDAALSDSFKGDAAAIKQGDVASGIAGLLVHAGQAAIDHPKGVFQYVAENAPQLLVGAFGTAGKVAMTASNIGYAADFYQQGIENFKKENGGKLPSPEDTRAIAGWAASLAVAEEVGDHIGVSAMGLGSKAAKLAGAAETEAAKAGLKRSLMGTAKAFAEGATGETVTEGYQNFAEDVTSGKTKDWKTALGTQDAWENIYKGAVIGGLSGGLLSSSVHAMSEAAGTTEAHAEDRKSAADAAETFRKAVTDNTPDIYLDPQDQKTYNPSKAMGVLLENNRLDTTTPEDRIQNTLKANQILRDLAQRGDELREQLKSGTATDPKAAQAELKRISVAENAAFNVSDQITAENNKQILPADVDAQVEQASAPVEADNAPAQAAATTAAQSVLNLSMASSEHLDPQAALNVAENTDNGLTDDERQYLRAFSDARIKENQLSSMSVVSQRILNGDERTGDVGIAQYRARIGGALAVNDQTAAQGQLDMLSNFAQDHADKAAAARQALDEGMGRQIIRVGKDWVVKPKNTLSQSELKRNGGLAINSEELVENIEIEAQAINATRDEMSQAVSLKFGKATGVAQNPNAGVQSISPADATQATPATATPPLSDAATQTQEKEGTQENILPKQTGKDSAHLKQEASETVAAEPQNQGNSKFSEALKSRQEYLRNPPADHTTDKTRAIVKWAKLQNARLTSAMASEEEGSDRHTELSDHRDDVRRLIKDGETSIEADEHLERDMLGNSAPSPSSTPASLTVADAPSATASSSASARDMDVQAQLDLIDQRATEAKAAIQREDTEQQAKAPAESAAAEVATAEGKKEDIIGLDVQRTPENEDRPYQKRNLIADFFVQRTGAKEGSVRPLASVKDFLSTVMNSPKTVFDFMKLEQADITPEQNAALTTFVKAAQAWSKFIDRNLTKLTDSDYYYKDVMQFLINDQGKVAENVSTAMSYAAFSWVAENATRPELNTPDEIRNILQLGEDEFVDPSVYDRLATIGSREAVVINALGQRAVQALGLSAVRNAPRNLQPQLESAVGAHVMKLLVDRGILIRNTIKGEEMARLTGLASTSTTADFRFLALARNQDGSLAQRVENIVTASKGSKGVVDKLFGVEPALKAPSNEPIPFAQKTTRNTDQAVPKVMAKIVARENAAAHHLNTDMWNVVSLLGKEATLQMAGFQEVDPATVHKVNQKPLQAKNDGLVREVDNAFEYFGNMEDQSAPMYFEHSVWKQQRVGIATNMINPQTSKVHRQMLYRPEWESKIDVNDVDNFLLRVAEGMGVKTDKQDNVKSLAAINEMLGAPEVRDAVDALRKVLDNPKATLTSDEQAAIVAGAKFGGEKMHSLSSLLAVAKYEKALAEGETHFTTQLMGEVDGVTNGPMLSHLLMGAAATVDGLFDLLNKGGFYRLGSEHSQYNLWRSTPGKLDLYETTTSRMSVVLNSLSIPASTLNALYVFTGKLTEGDKVVKAGRDIIKTPLTAMVFGSSVSSAVESMADRFIEGIYAKIEDVAKGKAERTDVLQALKQLGVEVDDSMTAEQMMETVLTPADVGILKQTFTDTIGEAVSQTMDTHFKPFLDQRTQFNNTAQLAFEMYNAAQTTVKDAYIAELLASGEIASREITKGKDAGKREALHDLTNAQQAELDNRLAGLLPIMQTAFSKESGQLDSGLLASKSDRVLSDRAGYTNEVHFGSAFAGETNSKGGPIMSVGTKGYERTSTNPGVAMAPMSVHSTDANISLHAGEQVPSLNIHDARGAGVNQLAGVAQALNQSTWNAMVGYSPATEMANTLSRVVQGMPALFERSGADLQAALAKNLAGVLEAAAKKADLPVLSILDMAVRGAKQMAYTADDMKLQALEQMSAIDQYALEGGNYTVTDEDRAAASAARAKLTPELSAKETEALDKLHALLNDALTAVPAPKVKFKQGKAAVQSDNALVSFFKAGEVRTVSEVAAQLGKMNLTGFESKLLQSMVKVLGAADVTVRYVTKVTTTDQILEQPKQASRAWFVSRDGKNEIYVLGTEFKDSGLTKETLLHELVHATVARSIENATGEAKVLVAGLEELLAKTREAIAQRGLRQFAPAVADIHELVSWGMTNPQFQQLLANVQVSQASLDASLRTQLVSGIKSFIDTLVGLVFGKKNESAANGMRTLITNVSGLFKEAAQTRQEGTNTINQSMASTLDDLSTTDLYDALAGIGNSTVTPAFDEHLRGLLENVADKIQGPFGAFAAKVGGALSTPLDVWADAKVSGKAPFAFQSLASGLHFSEQEAFVAEQVEATVRSLFTDNAGSTTAAYQELVRLYNDVKAKVKPADFPSQVAYDFVFGVHSGADNKSDYLSRFAALGLANEQFNQMLQFQTPIKTGSLAGLSIAEKIHTIFENILTYINGKLTHTFEGQHANEKLTSLVSQLVNIESKKRLKLSQSPLVMVDAIEGTFRTAAEGIRGGVSKIGQSQLFKNSSKATVRLAGKVVTAVAQDRVDKLMDAIQTFRDVHLKEKNGLAMGLVNEVRGATPANAMFHKLLRMAKEIEGQRKDIISHTTQFILESFHDGGKYLTKEMKSAISSVLLRSDVASLINAGFDMAGITKLVTNQEHVKRQIALAEQELDQFGAKNKQAYINLSKILAYKLATGRVTSRSILMNAENIASLYGTSQAGKISGRDISAATEIIDPLITLHALNYHHDAAARSNEEVSPLDHLAEVLAMENGRGNANGVEMALKLHAQLQQQSKDRLFNTAGPLQMKGYLPEVYNPYVRVLVADQVDGKDLVERGYTEGEAVTMDDADPDKKGGKRLYVIRDGGLTQHLTGTISYTGMRTKGAKTHNDNLNVLSDQGITNIATMASIKQENQPHEQSLFDAEFKPEYQQGNFLAPVLNGDGKVVNYRYMMSENTKDALLERDNRFDQLLGSMAGNIFDKEKTAEQNEKVIQALHDQYTQDFGQNAGSYVRVGANSSDTEMREIWALLPEATKQSIRSIWGGNNMYVRYDMLDINFGYRKLSITDPFGIPPEERGRFEKLYVETMEMLMGKKAGLYLGRFEDVWQALVREAKDTMVVKSGVTLLGNFTSNVSELIWFGVPMKDIVRNHRIALKGVMTHQKDSAELARLQIELDTGYLQSGSRSEIQNRIAQLKDSMARNPVRELIDAGLMPTIVEDVANEDDQYSFKGQLTRKVDDVLGKLNPHVLAAGKFITMAHDTPLYQVMSYGTQVSDFVARYTLYQHVISRSKDKLSADKAVQLVSDAFVNYDVPSHRLVQYANDVGLVYFSKYYLRIQKVIALLYRQNPGRALMLLTLGHFLDFIPMLQHSSALHRFGNPFSMGALDSLTSLNEMATVNALMTPFR